MKEEPQNEIVVEPAPLQSEPAEQEFVQTGQSSHLIDEETANLIFREAMGRLDELRAEDESFRAKIVAKIPKKVKKISKNARKLFQKLAHDAEAEKEIGEQLMANLGEETELTATSLRPVLRLFYLGTRKMTVYLEGLAKKGQIQSKLALYCYKLVRKAAQVLRTYAVFLCEFRDKNPFDLNAEDKAGLALFFQKWKVQPLEKISLAMPPRSMGFDSSSGRERSGSNVVRLGPMLRSTAHGHNKHHFRNRHSFNDEDRGPKEVNENKRHILNDKLAKIRAETEKDLAGFVSTVSLSPSDLALPFVKIAAQEISRKNSIEGGTGSARKNSAVRDYPGLNSDLLERIRDKIAVEIIANFLHSKGNGRLPLREDFELPRELFDHPIVIQRPADEHRKFDELISDINNDEEGSPVDLARVMRQMTELINRTKTEKPIKSFLEKSQTEFDRVTGSQPKTLLPVSQESLGIL